VLIKKAALSHLCSAAQAFRVVVGYAGAGKSTAFSVAQGIWGISWLQGLWFLRNEGKAAQGLSLGDMPFSARSISS